jgi:hypothetical protein
MSVPPNSWLIGEWVIYWPSSSPFPRPHPFFINNMVIVLLLFNPVIALDAFAFIVFLLIVLILGDERPSAYLS